MEQPKWCNYPDATTPALGCWSLLDGLVKDEHYCYFDDLYSPEYALEWIYKEIKKYKIDEESQVLLDIGHSEILDSECYQEYGYPSYL